MSLFGLKRVVSNGDRLGLWEVSNIQIRHVYQAWFPLVLGYQQAHYPRVHYLMCSREDPMLDVLLVLHFVPRRLASADRLIWALCSQLSRVQRGQKGGGTGQSAS